MIIFLFGPDNYRSRQKLKEIADKYKKVHKSGLNLNYFDCEEEQDVLDKLREGFFQSSMFEEKKLQVVFNPFGDKSFQADFLDEADIFIKSSNIIVLYQNNEPDKRTKFFKFLKERTKSQEFSLLQGARLKAWILKEFEKYDSEIQPSALSLLMEKAGDDLWRLSNEIQKLVNFKNKKSVAVEDVRLLVRSEIESDIFKTIDAISQKNKKQAIDLLHRHLEKGDSPLYLLSMVNFQFRNLLIVKPFLDYFKPYSVIARQSGLHPFVVRKSLSQAKQFSLEELKKIYHRIAAADLKIKIGQLEPETALDFLVYEI